MVARAYRSWGFKPKRVLYAMGAKSSAESPVSCLRRHLDEPEFRLGREDRRAEKAIPPFYNALYKYLKGTVDGRAVHNRLIASAEFESGDKIFLDPVRFRDLLAAEKSGLQDQPPSIEPSSEEELLALFALAFALLQPSQAYDILEPLLRLGPPYQKFFGATKHIGQEAPELHDRSDGGTEQQRQAESQIADAPSVSASTRDELCDIEQPIPARRGKPSELPRSGKEKPGPRSLLLITALRQWQAARTQRCELGSAPDLRLENFELAYRREQEASTAYRETMALICRDFQTIQDKLTAVSNQERITIAEAIPVDSEPERLAEWIDRTEESINQVLAIAEAVAQNRGAVAAFEPTLSEFKRSHTTFTLPALTKELNERNEALATKVTELAGC